jgi:hypothetical protein
MKIKFYLLSLSLLFFSSILNAQTVSYTDCYLNQQPGHPVSFVPTGGVDADGRTIYASSGDDGTGLSYLLMYCKTIAVGGGNLVEGWGIYPYVPGLGNPNCNSTTAFYNTTRSLTPPPVGLGLWTRPPGTTNTCPDNNLVLTVPPILTTNPATNITLVSAILSGAITSVGNTNAAYGSSPSATILERGITYSTNPNPTIGNGLKISSGQDNGAISSSLTGLQLGTTYYYRTYATSSLGTGYGPNVSFTTSTIKPTNGIVYVKKGATGDGSSWNNAASELSLVLRWAHQKKSENSVSWAAKPLQIWVAGGIYKPMFSPADNNFGEGAGRNNSFLMVKNVQLYGGFAGDESTLTQRNLTLVANRTIISGDVDDDDELDVTGQSLAINNNSENNHHVIISSGDVGAAELNGFTITGGNANGSGSIAVNANTINHNMGGGVHNNNASPTISNCIYIGNSAAEGGGMFSVSSTPSLYNSVFTRNAAGYGAGIYSGFSPAKIYNTTVVGNSGEFGSGIYVDNSSNSIYNSLIWDNVTGNFTSSHSLVRGGTDFTNGNIDPTNITGLTLFKDIANPAGADGILGSVDDGLHLQICSSTINAGNNTNANNNAVDITGSPRIQGLAVDMGAYEYAGHKNGNPGGADLLALNENQTSTTITSNTLTTLTVNGSLCRTVATILPNQSNPVRGVINLSVYIDGTVQFQNGSPYVQRHYEITPEQDALTASARLTLYYTHEDFTEFNRSVTEGLIPSGPDDQIGKSNLRVYQYHGTPTDGNEPSHYEGDPITIDPLDEDIVWNTTKERWEISFDVTGFSGFYVGTASASLPVKIVRFNVKETEGAALLKWQTTSEVNASHFVVERSTDAKTYQSLGKISSKGGETGVQNYEFLDTEFKTLSATAYYRLRMTDIDGSFTYSGAISLAWSNSNQKSQLYPNPVKVNSAFLLESSSPISKIRIVDQHGRQVYFPIQPIGDGRYQIQVGSAVKGGLYILQAHRDSHLILVDEM